MPPTTIGVRPAASAASISARASSANAPAEKVSAIGTNESEAVLEPGLLGGVGRAGEHLEPAVDLQGVGGDGQRVLPRAP